MSDVQRPHETDDTISTLISAGLFLIIGFGLGWKGISDSSLFNASIDAVVWTGRIVGIGLLLALALHRMGIPQASFLSLIMSVIAALGTLLPGLVLSWHGQINGYLLVLFGIMNCRAAYTSLRSLGAPA